MLKTKKRSLIAFLLCAIVFNNTYTMDQPEEGSTLGWVAVIGGVLLGAVAMKYLWQEQKPGTQFDFAQLPQDVQYHIIELLNTANNTQSLDIATKTINSLAQVNKELNQMLNEPQFCLKLIKHLSKKFNYSNQLVAEKLQTKESKRRLALQARLHTILFWPNSRKKNLEKKLEQLYQSGADLEFTYKGLFLNTPLMILSCAGLNKDYPQNILHGDFYLHVITEEPAGFYDKYSYQDSYIIAMDQGPKMIKYLLSKGVNINAQSEEGITALMFACSLLNFWAIDTLTKNSTITINQQDHKGNTALMHLCNNPLHIIPVKAIFKLLINAGANPNLANKDGLTPIDILLTKDQNDPNIKEITHYLKKIAQESAKAT